MARVTVEDCITKIPNRFELVMVAAQRAKDISSGAKLTVEKDNDKNAVIALREIADDTISVEEIQKSLVTSLQKYTEVQETEEEELEIIAAEKELSELDEELLTSIDEIPLPSEEELGEEDDEYAPGEDIYEDDGELTGADDFAEEEFEEEFEDFTDEDENN